MPQSLTTDLLELEQIVIQQLPLLVEQSPQIRKLVVDLAEHKKETGDKFYQILNELKRDREEQAIKWAEQSRKWEEQDRKWAEQKAEDKRKWEEQDRKWVEQKAEDKRKWEEQDRKWSEQKAEDKRKWDEAIAEDKRKWDEAIAEDKRKWDEWKAENQRQREEQDRKWAEQKAEDKRKWDEWKAENQRQREEQNRKWDDAKKDHESLMTIVNRHDRSISALGARWGIQSEAAFRQALAGILEESFGVEVLNLNDYDHEGMVFGRPEQVEIDVIIQNGLSIACELKSSIDKAGMYIFERKVRFYEKSYQRQVSRMLVVSPMVDPRARAVAEKLGIEVYSDSTYVKP